LRNRAIDLFVVVFLFQPEKLLSPPASGGADRVNIDGR
jgi:hypothetical protein